MDRMYLISQNSENKSINLPEPIILASETSHKDNLHLVEAMKADCCKDFMKAMKKEIKYLTT